VTTPTTLIALARTVAHLWRQNELNENAEKAARLGEELYSRISVLLGHIEKLGKSLNASVETYNAVIGSVDRRVLPTLRRLEDLSVAPPGRVPAQPQMIEARAGVPDAGAALPDGAAPDDGT
jgi:DNA recombination protein RmuC